MTTNITNGNRVLNELQATEPMKLPPAEQSATSYNPFSFVCWNSVSCLKPESAVLRG